MHGRGRATSCWSTSASRPSTRSSASPVPVLIPKGEFLSGEALAELPQDKQIVLHCKSGARSAEALAVLKQAGFADAVHVGGGVTAWVDAGRQVAARLLNRFFGHVIRDGHGEYVYCHVDGFAQPLGVVCRPSNIA